LVFYKAENNQSWTYFGSLYFAYTSLLTIGYGDYRPYSNSGKPFFVFWSLLAVPALTILISDMGDTVVKIIKDFTIYLGEITVLPSDEGGLSDSLKYGVYKITGGKVGNKVTTKTDNDVKEKPPGMVNMPEQSQQRGTNQHDVESARHLADQLESEEKQDEQEARNRGDKLAEDEHHYRHLLISEMKKMYSYVNTEPPKKFTYDEWAYFLRLLGEDEHDQRYHRRAPIKVIDRKGDINSDSSRSSPNGKDEVHAEGDQSDAPVNQFAKDNNDIKEWSWLGNRSPLMGDKDEAEWILESLFAVLERDLRNQKDSRQHNQSRNPGRASEAQQNQGKDSPRIPPA
jgi:potassium channel subfamily K, other eukaryote